MEESIKMMDVDYLIVIASIDFMLENHNYEHIGQKLELERCLEKFRKACPEIRDKENVS